MRGNFKKGGWKGKQQSKSKDIQINFFIIDQKKVGVEIPFGHCTQMVKNHLREYGSGVWSYDDKCWIVQRQKYEQVFQKLQDHFYRLNNHQSNEQKIIKVNPIEDFVLKAQNLLKNNLQEIKITNLKPYSNLTLKYNPIQTNIDPQSLPFYQKLFDFQKESLKFGIKHHGRMLLADEMGVGKTIQSLAIAYIYKHQWPLLIICPPTLKFNWQNQIKRWYPDIQPHQIQLINQAKTAFRANVLIMIISYDLAWRMKEMFEHVRIVIADEAHYLKSADSKRSQILVPFLSTRKRVILLTGTPAFARPKQIYNLISIVRPQLFKSFKHFGNRYCEPKWNHWSHSYEYNGCKNVKELHYILKDNIMIRRLKADVLTQLPDKNRQKVTLQTDSSVVKNIKEILQKNNINKMQTFFSEYINTASSFEQQTNDKRQEIMQAYRLSGIAKIKALKQYIDQILENNIKILVFAHHMKVMDEIQNQLKNKKHKFMRIDGSVSQQERQNNVQKFQNDPQILVALLSITAAGVGITLTAASTVIFAQLHWTPALMIQAQDRAHRVGQKDSVNCHYLIGQGTLDEMLYKFLQKKVLNVSSFVDGQRKDLQFEDIEKGVIGKFSKKESMLPINRKSNFGANLMQQIGGSRQKDKLEQNTQKTQLTDISNSTYKQSKLLQRKRPPSTTLDSFVIRKSQLTEKQQQPSELKDSKDQFSFNKKRRSGSQSEIESGSQQEEKKVQQKSWSFKKHNKPVIVSRNSDDQFQQFLDHYYKGKSKSHSFANKKVERTANNNNQQVENNEILSTQSVKGSISSQSLTQSVKTDDQYQNQVQI